MAFLIIKREKKEKRKAKNILQDYSRWVSIDEQNIAEIRPYFAVKE
jgi:hypothetical protein